MPAVWCVERTRNARFPFRVTIDQDGRLLLAVRAQSAWPAPGAQIFCLRERAHHAGEPLEPVERVPVATLTRVGAKLTVVLDRPTRKRCEFLALRKPRVGGSGEHEQIFFRTESAIRAHHTRGRLELRSGAPLEVAIDLQERYPWRFPEARVSRRRLPIGDYALVRDEKLLAVAERKTLENLLTDFGHLRALHQQLAELASQPRAALVVEAQYRDFLEPAKTRAWSTALTARALAEISALHPRLPVVFAGNRKLANAWVVRWFGAVAADAGAPELPLFVSDALARYEPAAAADGGVDQRIREAALVRLASPFRAAEVAAAVAGAGKQRVARVLAALRREGRVRCVGRGPGATWARNEPA